MQIMNMNISNSRF